MGMEAYGVGESPVRLSARPMLRKVTSRVRVAVPQATVGQLGSEHASMPNSKYGYAGMADPMGVHHLNTTRDKILRGKYMDIISLLQREVLSDSKPGQDKQNKEMSKWPRVPKTWEN